LGDSEHYLAIEVDSQVSLLKAPIVATVEQGVRAMKVFPSKRSAGVTGSSYAGTDRRGVVIGFGVASAAAVAAQALHHGAVQAPLATAAKAVPVESEGYRLTPHVWRYYETTKA
jgi:hypothetical protein